MNIVLFGPPASGKGTQAEFLEQELGLKHINAGKLLRREIAEKTDLGKKIKGIIEQGKLIDDELAAGIVEREVRGYIAEVEGFVFDGFPRTVKQAKILEKLLKGYKKEIDVVIDLFVDEKTIVGRISSRRNCAGCGASYNLVTNPPKRKDKCDDCGGELYIRKDDTAEAVRERIREYNERTKPLEEFYKGKGLLLRVDGSQSIERVAEEVRKALKKRFTST